MPTSTYMPGGSQMPGAVSAGVWLVAGAPVDGTSGTGAGVIIKGGLVADTTNANLYINAGTQASPVWKLVTRAA
jgi:hypothetical protein